MAKRQRERAPPDIVLVAGIPTTHLRPDTELQALMESPPGVTPDLARNQLAPLREILADTIHNTLTDRELWIFEALVYRRMSLRRLATELAMSKTHIARLRDHINQKLQEALLQHEIGRAHV